MPKRHTRQLAYDRRHLPCTVTYCGKRRTGVGLYCHNHHKRFTYYGHPLQHPLKHAELAPYLSAVKLLARANRKHPALLACYDAIARWLETASARVKAKDGLTGSKWEDRLNRELWRLAELGTSPKDIFTRLVAVHFLSMDQRDRLAPVTRQYKFALARAFLLTRRRREKFGCNGQHIPSRVLSNFGGFLSTFFRRTFEAMAAPFSLYWGEQSKALSTTQKETDIYV